MKYDTSFFFFNLKQMQLHPSLPLMSSAQWGLGLVQQSITEHALISITADLFFNHITVSCIHNLFGSLIFIVRPELQSLSSLSKRTVCVVWSVMILIGSFDTQAKRFPLTDISLWGWHCLATNSSVGWLVLLHCQLSATNKFYWWENSAEVSISWHLTG